MTRSFWEPKRQPTTIRVLHVDDEREFAELAAEYLEREHEDVTVTTAFGVRGAIEKLAEREYDCVVSDYDMPEATGLDLLRHVRAEYGDLPFILFTGKGNEEIASKAISEGVNDYLQKDTGTDQYAILVNRIENLVERSRKTEQLRVLKERYEAIARSTADALWDWIIEDTPRVDEQDTVIRSDGFSRTFGYDPDEVKNELGWWTDRIHPDDRKSAKRAANEAVKEGKSYYEDEFRFKCADGTYTEVLCRGYVLYDGDEPVRMVGAIIDKSRF